MKIQFRGGPHEGVREVDTPLVSVYKFASYKPIVHMPDNGCRCADNYEEVKDVYELRADVRGAYYEFREPNKGES